MLHEGAAKSHYDTHIKDDMQASLEVVGRVRPLLAEEKGTAFQVPGLAGIEPIPDREAGTRALLVVDGRAAKENDGARSAQVAAN